MISGSGCDLVPVGMSPLVAGITDALLQLVQLNATPEMVRKNMILHKAPAPVTGY